MRFTIRDLLWLTLLVAVAVAWWVDRSSQARREQRIRQDIDWIYEGRHPIYPPPPSLAR